jgi:DNA-binding transcriptional MerR regulator
VEGVEMRVEQMSAEAGVSVDTIRYYQSKGLLAPPRRQGRFAWYGDDHLDRLIRIRSLQERGFTLATIVRLLNGDLDAADEALVAELTGTGASGVAIGSQPRPLGPAGSVGPAGSAGLAGSAPNAGAPVPAGSAVDNLAAGGFTLEALAERTGVPLALLKAVEAEGLLVPQRMGTEERYTHEDVAAAEAGLLLLEWGVPLSALLDLSRRHHVATEAVAREAVDMFSTHVRGALRDQRREGDTTDQEAARLVQAFAELLPAVNTLVGHHFTRTLLKAAFDHIEHEGSDVERQAVWAEAVKVVNTADGEAPASSAGPS